MSEYPASRETDARIAEVLGYPVKHLAVINGGPKHWFVMGDIGIRGRCPHYTTAAPDDWSAVGEMVAWLRERGFEVMIRHTSDCVGAEAWHEGWAVIIYSEHCASAGHAVAQVLLQVAEREATDD